VNQDKKVYYLIKGVIGLSFYMMFTAAIIYRIDIAKLSVIELILLGSALEIAIFVFETPTGVVADLVSRKLSVVIGLVIIGLGFILEGLTTMYVVIFVAQVVWGLGYTFISGALDSWISDQLDNESIEKIYISGAQIDRASSFVGIVLAAIIGMVEVRMAIFTAGSLMILLAIIVAIVMYEAPFEKSEHSESLFSSYSVHLIKGFKHIRAQKLLKSLFIVMLFLGLFSEGIDRTYELFILDELGFRSAFKIEPIWIVAFVNASIALITAFALEVVKRKIEQSKRLVLVSAMLLLAMVLGIISFAFSKQIGFALLGFIWFTISRHALHPILNAIIIKNTPSKIKATTLSTFGQLDAVGQLLSGALMVAISVPLGLLGIYVMTIILLAVPCALLFKESIRN